MTGKVFYVIFVIIEKNVTLSEDMKFIRIIALLLFFGSLPASAQLPGNLFKMTFSPNWTAQSQYAGYYVAKEKGFFRAEGLEVEILHLPITSSANLVDELEAGRVDIITNHLVASIVKRASGSRMVNVLQTSQNSSLMLVAHSPIMAVMNNPHSKVAVWKTCSEVATMVINDMMKDCTIVPIMQSNSVFYSNAVDAVTATSYNEYYKIMLAEGQVPEENVMRCSNIGYNYPEDGLYVMENFYRKNRKEVEAFCRAVRKGWDYARQYPEQAREIVRIYTRRDKIKTNDYHQLNMLEEVLRQQVNPATGKADYAPVSKELFDEIVTKMLNQKLISCPIKYEDFIR